MEQMTKETVLALLREYDMIDNESEGVSLLACLEMYDNAERKDIPLDVLARFLRATANGIDWVIDPPDFRGSESFS